MRTTTCILVILVAAVMAGCEDSNEPASYGNMPAVSPLRIDPSMVVLGPTNSYAVFKASGGSAPYTWSLGDKSLGTIPASASYLITYTRVDSTYGAQEISVIDANGWTSMAEIWQPDTTNKAALP
jgi:hypothetical protein